MANELRAPLPDTGVLVRGVVVNSAQQVYRTDTHVFETLDLDEAENYEVTMTETPSGTGIFVGSFPTTLTVAGIYDVDYYLKADLVTPISFAPDDRVGSQRVAWNGATAAPELPVTFPDIMTELRTRFRLLANEPSALALANSDIDLLFDQAARETNQELRYFYRTDDDGIILVAGTGSYDLPEDCLEPVWLRWNGKQLTRSTVEDWENREVPWRTQESAAPLEYALQGRSILFYPIPNAAAVTTAPSPVLRYVGNPDAFAATGPAQLAAQHYDLLVLRALAIWHTTPQNIDLHGGSGQVRKDEWMAGVTAAKPVYAAQEGRP